MGLLSRDLEDKRLGRCGLRAGCRRLPAALILSEWSRRQMAQLCCVVSGGSRRHMWQQLPRQPARQRAAALPQPAPHSRSPAFASPQVWAADMDDAEDTVLRLMRFKQNPGNWVPPNVSGRQQGSAGRGCACSATGASTAGTACRPLPLVLLTNQTLPACLSVVPCSRRCPRRLP